MSRDTGFDIAVASEVMAVLALATDMKDLRARWVTDWGYPGVSDQGSSLLVRVCCFGSSQQLLLLHLR
jgi:hypothetical protein